MTFQLASEWNESPDSGDPPIHLWAEPDPGYETCHPTSAIATPSRRENLGMIGPYRTKDPGSTIQRPSTNAVKEWSLAETWILKYLEDFKQFKHVQTPDAKIVEWYFFVSIVLRKATKCVQLIQWLAIRKESVAKGV